MKALIQRVTQASVTVDTNVVGKIDQGLMVLLGIEKSDSDATIDKMIERLLEYRVHSDADGKMNLSTEQIGGGLLVVSQFTLAADTKRGRRPSFSGAASPADAKVLYDHFVSKLQARYAPVAFGEFAADMQVSLVNDGPVTFLLEVV